ncbi:hypothetical protein LIER_19484 [Lithospermum erythrorhizon]|uniref:Uncharacterized protein n=1 Tax=Lithospermum erythrorhizon TaxID=34254 RepID=A0AAV3QHZ1_LITER
MYAATQGCFQPSQVANVVVALGIMVVLAFYTIMVMAPRAPMTRKSTESRIPYFIFGSLYAYLLYLSFKPETLYSTIKNSCLNPDELPEILRMLTNEMIMA